MSLNIKNERTHQLVRQLAAARGVSQTSAVEEAVARRLAELQAPTPDRDRRIDLALGRVRAEVTPDDRAALLAALRGADDLYDEAGLPR